LELVLFGIVVPVGYFFAFDGLPFEGVKGIAVLAGVGIAVGATLGALFPRVFGFIFEMFPDI
jgi:hypothetical protein